MIPLIKLERIPPGQRRRKIALLLASMERTLAEDRPVDDVRPEYLLAVAALAAKDPKAAPSAFTAEDRALLEPAAGGPRAEFPRDRESLRRLANHARHSLLSATGLLPAEWDLILPNAGTGAVSGVVADVERPHFPGVCVYAEDIRSPFNVGSIFRTAEAFGAERVYVSPGCAPPDHPRSIRSAMGCVGYLPWERLALDDLPSDAEVFALETGGTPIDEFDFPERGIVILGSEELGISPEGLARAKRGRVTIPMRGLKASINVGVAFGILMQAWTAYLACSDSKPR